MSYLTSLRLLRISASGPSAATFFPPNSSQIRAASNFSRIHSSVRQSQRQEGKLSHYRTDRNRYDVRGSKKSDSKKRDSKSGLMSSDDFNKAMVGEEAEEGRKSRRHRFMDKESKFGKNSLVYMMKNGPLKEKADRILAAKAQEAELAKRKALNLPVATKDIRPKQPQSFPDRNNGNLRDSSSRSSKEMRSSPSQLPDRQESRSFDGWGSKENQNSRFSERREPHQFDNRDDIRNDSRDRSGNLSDSFCTGRRASAPNASDALRKNPVIGTPIVPYTTAASQFIFGKSAVKSALFSKRRKLYHLYIYNGTNRRDNHEDSRFIALAEEQNLKYTLVPTEGQPLMDRMSQGRPHNGYILEASPLPQPPVVGLGELDSNPRIRQFSIVPGHQTLEDLEINGKDTTVTYDSPSYQKPLVLLLHEIVDPGNVGNIIRTARFMGAAAVAITTANTASVTPVVIKAAAGAIEEIPILTVHDSAKFLQQSKKAGWKVLTTVAPDSRSFRRALTPEKLQDIDPLAESPCILVFGNEGLGLPRFMKALSDLEVSIPRVAQVSGVDSLNVSVAVGLLCHSLLAEREISSVASKADKVASQIASHAQANKQSSERLF